MRGAVSACRVVFACSWIHWFARKETLSSILEETGSQSSE